MKLEGSGTFWKLERFSSQWQQMYFKKTHWLIFAPQPSRLPMILPLSLQHVYFQMYPSFLHSWKHPSHLVPVPWSLSGMLWSAPEQSLPQNCYFWFCSCHRLWYLLSASDGLVVEALWVWEMPRVPLTILVHSYFCSDVFHISLCLFFQ